MGAAVSHSRRHGGTQQPRRSSAASPARHAAAAQAVPPLTAQAFNADGTEHSSSGAAGDAQMMPRLSRRPSPSLVAMPTSSSAASLAMYDNPRDERPIAARQQRPLIVRGADSDDRQPSGDSGPATALPRAEDSGQQRNGAAVSEEDGMPLTEEMGAMAGALAKPYGTLCQRIRAGKRRPPSPSAYPVEVPAEAGFLSRSEEGDCVVKADLSAVAPCMEPFVWLDPPPRASPAVVDTYPVRWFPNITPCFDEGLLYRIEWRRHGRVPLPGETDDFAYVAWCFYNSTPCYMMDIEVAFEAPSSSARMPLRAWGETKLSWKDGAAPSAQPRRLVARTTCPPLTTVGFVAGRAGAFRTSIHGRPMSASALQSLATLLSVPEVAPALRRLSSHTALQLALRDGQSFVDPEFPPGDAALNGSAEDAGGSAVALPPLASARWMRASEVARRIIGSVPASLSHVDAFAAADVHPCHIAPGELGDSWLVGAMAVAAEHFINLVRLLQHPTSPEVSSAERALGAYRVTLSVKGWWRSVLVDDYIPITPGNYAKYAHSSRDVREVWVSLVEKAYAKVCGGYRNIVAGDPLDALRAFTGWPSARYDIAKFREVALASSAFASRLMRYERQGLQIIFHTDPSLPLGEKGGGDGGLVPGMVYTVLRIAQFSATSSSPELTLVKIRNAWGDVGAWRGRWRCGSPRWAQWPAVAEACDMPVRPVHPSAEEEAEAAPVGEVAPSRPCRCRADPAMWMEWGEVCRYFAGCAVLFRLSSHHDYRVRGVFDGVEPSVCLRLTVASRSFIAVTLTMQDSGTAELHGDGSSGSSASALPPIMISLARERNNALHVLRNSQIDPDNPTAVFTFMQAANVSMLSLLTPEEGPYWVIPRILSAPAAAPPHGSAAGAVRRRPYVLGYLHKGAVGVKGGPRADFVRLPSASPAFSNSVCFPRGAAMPPTEAVFQVRGPEEDAPKTYKYTGISEEKAARVDDISESRA